MYLRPHDLLVMTAVGLAPPPQLTLRQRERRGPVAPPRRRRGSALRRLLGRVLLRAGIRLLRSARRTGAELQQPAFREALS